jgi:hypothetical protein
VDGYKKKVRKEWKSRAEVSGALTTRLDWWLWFMCVCLAMYKQDFLINCLSSRSLFSCCERFVSRFFSVFSYFALRFMS